MQCFEFMVAESHISTGGGPFETDDELWYVIPDEAEELLEPILEPYNQSPTWFFTQAPPPAPWALACFDREYEIAGHIATSRPSSAEIFFSPYAKPPDPEPERGPGQGLRRRSRAFASRFIRRFDTPRKLA